VLHTACWKYRTQKNRHRTNLSGCIFGTKAYVDNWKKNFLNTNTSSTCPDNMANFGLLTAEICWRLWGTPDPCRFQLVSRLGSVTARHSISGRQPNFAALNRGRHVYSAGRPSRWALAHILLMAALCNRAGHYIFAL